MNYGQNYGYYNNDSNRCCRFICGFTVGVCIIAAAALVIAHFVTYPKPPIIYVSSVTVSGLSLGQWQPTFSGNFQVELKVINQDQKMTASYTDFRTAVYYKNYQLGVGLPSMHFRQLKGESGSVTANVNVNGVYLQEPVVVLPDGNVIINIRVWSDVKFGAGWFGGSRQYRLKALCDGLQVGFASGLLVGGDRSCFVQLYL